MKIRVVNHVEFLNCIYDYVAENYAIELQSFVIDVRPSTVSLIYSDRRVLGAYEIAVNRECDDYNGHVHVHEGREGLHCCTEVDTLALRYLNDSLVHRDRERIILSLHDWLPSATAAHVRATFESDESSIASTLEPTYALAFLRERDLRSARLEYQYFSGNIDLLYGREECPKDESESEYLVVDAVEDRSVRVLVMARRRRSRSRSRSPGRPRSVGRPRIRRRRKSTSSRARTYSPMRSSSPRRSYARRSRSRSRSRSARR